MLIPILKIFSAVSAVCLAIPRIIFRPLLKNSYAVCLAIPRIIFHPLREFAIVIPKSGLPFVSEMGKNEQHTPDDFDRFRAERMESSRALFLEKHRDVAKAIEALIKTVQHMSEKSVDKGNSVTSKAQGGGSDE